jgi:hypothetical protein
VDPAGRPAAPAAQLVTAWRDAPPREWDAWAARAAGTSFSVCEAWIAAHEALDPRPRFALLEARRGDALAGALPSFRTRRFGREWLHSMPFGTYGGPLVATGDPDPASVREALGLALQREVADRKLAGADVTTAPASGSAGEPDAAWARFASALPQEAHRLDLSSGIDALEATLRRETRKGFRHAERAGVRAAPEASALSEVHGLYLTQAKAWGLRNPYPIGFFRALLEHPARSATLWVARAEGRPHVGILALSGGGETFLWWSGADPVSRQSLAYPYLIWEIARDAARRGERWVSLGASGGRAPLHRFKESLGAVSSRYWVYRVPPAASDWMGRALQWARARRGR